MKNKTIIANQLWIPLIALFILSSCGKYEDGPLISLFPKKERLVNTWKIEKIFKNNKEIYVNDSLKANYREYKSNGDAVFYNYNASPLTGTWEFHEKNNYVLTSLKYNDTLYKEKARILKLKQKEFWAEVELESGKYEYHFVEK